MGAIDRARPGGNPAVETTAAYDAERTALARVLESRHFLKAPLLSAFLAFVCEAALSEEAQRVTEQEIGIRVFRRPVDYNPGEDNIVRNYARQLRRRLEAYYLDEGRTEPLRIEMPKGGYAVSFRRPISAAPRTATPVGSIEAAVEEAAEAAAETGREPAASEPRAKDRRFPGDRRAPAARNHWPWVIALSFMALCALAAFIVQRVTRPRSALHGLWSQIFQMDRDTLVVPADVGFVIVQQMSNRTFSLAEYESWAAVEQYDHVYASFLKAQKYTSMLDLETVARLERLPEALPDRLFARAARGVSTEDLGNDNLILLGSSYSNPWVEVFERNLNFRFVNRPQEGRFWIENTHPLRGEAARYENTTRSITHETYGVIALLPNLSKSGHVLIVEGLDGPGTQAAVDLLLRGDALGRVLKQAARPDGTLGGFEVLLAATGIDNRATGTRIIAERYNP